MEWGDSHKRPNGHQDYQTEKQRMFPSVEPELRHLIAYSSDCVWRRDDEAYGACWAKDGEWHILGEVAKGRAAIVDRWSQLMAPFARVWQLAHNVVFDLSSTPSARLYLEETLVSEAGEVSLLKGIYHDEYTIEEGTWRFARRYIDIAYLGPADWSGKWFSMPDLGTAPQDFTRGRPATPSLAEAYGAG